MKYILNYIWAIIWAIVMLILLLMPGNEMPDLNKLHLFQGIDKVVHIGIFFIIALILYWESSLRHPNGEKKWNSLAKIVICTVIFAFLTEEAQKHVSSRTADKYDILADCIGIGMATASYILLHRKTVKK